MFIFKGRKCPRDNRANGKWLQFKFLEKHWNKLSNYMWTGSKQPRYNQPPSPTDQKQSLQINLVFNSLPYQDVKPKGNFLFVQFCLFVFSVVLVFRRNFLFHIQLGLERRNNQSPCETDQPCGSSEIRELNNVPWNKIYLMCIFIYFTLSVLYLCISRPHEMAPHCDTSPTKYFFKPHGKNKIYTAPWGSQTPDECKHTFLRAHESTLQWHPKLI